MNLSRKQQYILGVVCLVVGQTIWLNRLKYTPLSMIHVIVGAFMVGGMVLLVQLFLWLRRTTQAGQMERYLWTYLGLSWLSSLCLGFLAALLYSMNVSADKVIQVIAFVGFLNQALIRLWILFQVRALKEGRHLNWRGSILMTWFGVALVLTIVSRLSYLGPEILYLGVSMIVDGLICFIPVYSPLP